MTFYSGKILQRRSVYFVLIVVFSEQAVKPDSCLFMEGKQKKAVVGKDEGGAITHSTEMKCSV